MFLALWEFHVKPGCEERFERVYGPGGDRSRLFRSDPHYRATRLLRDPARPNCCTTLDFWDSRAAYESFKELLHAAYLALDKISDEFTRQERHLGSFSEIPEL
jgi:heme-degrading monooxygenase HmoA